MAIESLKKILQLENELYHAEQDRQEEISAWKNEQQVEIQRQFDSRIDALEKRKKDFKDQAVAEAKAEAAEILSQSEKVAAYLDSLEKSRLQEHLHKILPLILGQRS